jgi:DNA modification methylase
MAFEILQGDCIELARQLPDACLDAIVSDPPAGIEFLGRDWDTFGYKKGRLANYSGPPAGDVRDADVAFKHMGPLPSFDQKVNARCETCGKYRWSSNPCQCATPKWAKDTAARDSFVAFMTDVGKEALRTLKPGGFLIFWAIPRTSHWTAWALEEAGFQVKHVISHLRSTGFPKGLDIGKAMDRMRDDDIYHVTKFIAEARDAAGKTNPEIDEHFGYHGMAGHWTSSKSQPAVPTWENWEKLKAFLGFDDSLDEEVQKLNGRKGKPGDAWYERPIVGWETDGVQGHIFSAAGASPTYKTEFAVTDHVSEEAHAWDGWNTALRPNSEHWIVCQKPLAGRNYASNILQYGVGGLNVKGCGVPRGDGEECGWPSNIVVSHHPDCGETCVEGCPALELDQQSGFSSQKSRMQSKAGTTASTGLTLGEGWKDTQTQVFGDSGGASRYYNQFHYGPEDLPSFLYVPGASRAEKEAGCAEAGIEPKVLNRVNSGGLENDERWAPKLVYNDHPTVKSIALMRWLTRLVAPKGATVADFFCGSGTSACAAVLEGMNFIGFDLDARNVAISQARASYWSHRTEEATEGGLPVLSLRSAAPAVPSRTKPPRPAPALSLGLFEEDEE